MLVTGLALTAVVGVARVPCARPGRAAVVALWLAGAAAASTGVGQRAGRGRLVPARTGAAWRWACGRWRSRSGSASPRSRIAVVAERVRRRAPPCGSRSSPAALAAARRRRSSWSTRRARRRRRRARAQPLPRATPTCARIHGVSVLLVVPQFLVWTFALVWLVSDRGWSAAAAGSLVAGAQVAGALGRIAAGQLSDVVGQPDAAAALGRGRRRPARWCCSGLTAGLDAAVAVPLVVLATVRDRRRQRPGLHRRRRARRAVLVGPRPGRPEHRAVPHRLGRAAARGAAGRPRRATPPPSPSPGSSRCWPWAWCRCATSTTWPERLRPSG